jgi:glycosyltransferase involved in cell wall biosynthesis
MNILHITAYAHRGGCEKNCYHFIKGNPENSHELIVLGEEGPMSNEWENLNIDIVHLHIINKNLFSFRNQLKQYLIGKQYDVVICWSGIRLPLQLNALRSVTSQIRVYLGNPLNHNPVKDYLLNLFYICSSKVVLMPCSQFVADSFKTQVYFKNFDFKVSLNPIELPAGMPKKQLDDTKFKIGMVARLDPIKDHTTLIKAFKIVSEKLPNAELHLAGDGILRESLKKLAQNENGKDKVIFHGDVQNVYNLLNQWNIFVYSTTPNEGLGSVVAEAMANGLPCILCDLPMMRELAPSGDLALWFKPGNDQELANKILELEKDISLQSKMSIASYNHAQTSFSSKRFIDDFLAKLTKY